MNISLAEFLALETKLKQKKAALDRGQFEPYEGLEKDLHYQIAEELKRRRWYYVRSRTDKKTTTQLGVPDFIIAMPKGKTVWIEVKRKGGKLSPEQTVARHVLRSLEHNYLVVFSYEDFLSSIAMLLEGFLPPGLTDNG